MYHYHQRRDDSGWLRNCYHSVLQHPVRQDPVYYALVVMARSDGVFRLLTYSHYAKYVLPGDCTMFRHTDLNPRMTLETGVATNHSYTSMSLNHETQEHRIVVVEGFQNHL
jgi:hypothetical protein